MKKIDIAAIKAARRGCSTTRTSTDRPAFAMGGQDATCNTQEKQTDSIALTFQTLSRFGALVDGAPIVGKVRTVRD